MFGLWIGVTMADGETESLYYGWVVVLACFLGTLVVFGISYSFSVFFERILDEFGQSRGVTSLAFGVQTLTLYIGAVFVGVLVDRYGTRRLLVAGTAVTCLGLVWTSQAGSLAGLVLAYGVVTGFGLCAIYVVSYATVPRWFSRRLGLAGGAASAGLGVGMLVVAPAATTLIEWVGWRDAFVVFTVATAVVGLLAALLIRDDPVSADATLPGDEFVDEPATETAPRSLRDQFGDIAGIAFTSSFLFFFLALLLIYTTLYVVLGHFVVHVIDLGFSRTIGATAIAILGLASILARFGFGILGDRAGRVRIFVGCSALMGLVTLGLVWAHSVPALFAAAFLYGAGYGGNGALLSPLIADLYGRENINAIFGLASAAFALSGLTAPSVAGVAQEVLGTYDPVFAVSGVFAVVGAGTIVAAARVSCSGVQASTPDATSADRSDS